MGEELVPRSLIDADVLIDVPVAKTHMWYEMSGALKNLFGLLPAKRKSLLYHVRYIDTLGEIFTDIYRNFPPDVVIVDGTVSCEGDCPLGTPKQTNFILTSDDALSADVVLSRIMGFDLEEIPYLRNLQKQGLKLDYELIGNIKQIKPKSWKRPSPKSIGFLSGIIKIWIERRKFK